MPPFGCADDPPIAAAAWVSVIDRGRKASWTTGPGSSDKGKHFNDVQILFDNGLRDGTFSVRRLTNQVNRVADLGTVDFEIDPDVAKVAAKWRDDDCQAVAGHVYLENVKTTEAMTFTSFSR